MFSMKTFRKLFQLYYCLQGMTENTFTLVFTEVNIHFCPFHIPLCLNVTGTPRRWPCSQHSASTRVYFYCTPKLWLKFHFWNKIVQELKFFWQSSLALMSNEDESKHKLKMFQFIFSDIFLVAFKHVYYPYIGNSLLLQHYVLRATL
jgi:hypothetical protein